MEQKEAYFDFWFSYCSADKPQVDALYNALTVRKQNQIILRKIKTGRLDEQYVNARLLLHRYEWCETDNSGNGKKQVYRLVNGRRISQLIFDISNSDMRTIVLSEDYFLSAICMQELCMCLCANIARRDDKKILPHINSRLNDLLGTFRGAKHNFKLPDTNRFGEKYYPGISLASALEKTHCYLRQEFKSGLPGYFFGEITKDEFQALLTDMTDPLHYSLLAIPTEHCAEQTLDYAFDIIRKMQDTGLKGKLVREYESLLTSDFWVKLLPEKQRKDYLKQFSDLKDVDGAVKLLGKFKSALSNKSSVFDLLDGFDKIEEFCSLVLLKIIHPLYANTRKSSDGLVSVNVASETSLNHLNLLQAGIASAVVQHDHSVLAGSLSPRASDSVGRLLGALPRQETPKDTCAGDINQILLNIITAYLPEKKQEFTNNPEKTKKDARFWKEINLKLKHAGLNNKLPVVILREGQDTSKMGYYEALSELNKLLKITLEGKEQPAFSSIELRSPLPGNNGTQDSDQFAILSNDEYFLVKMSFSEIFELFGK